MKILIIIFSLGLSSCALYQDFLGPAPVATKGPAKEATPAVHAPGVPYEEMISKNWEYSRYKDQITNITTFEAKTISLDNDLHLTIQKNDRNEAALVLTLTKGEVSYREGHSIEIKIDGETFIEQVLPTDGKSSQTVKLLDAKKVCQLLQGKKEIIIELNLNGLGNRTYRFDISGLQKFFTAI